MTRVYRSPPSPIVTLFVDVLYMCLQRFLRDRLEKSQPGFLQSSFCHLLKQLPFVLPRRLRVRRSPRSRRASFSDGWWCLGPFSVSRWTRTYCVRDVGTDRTKKASSLFVDWETRQTQSLTVVTRVVPQAREMKQRFAVASVRGFAALPHRPLARETYPRDWLAHALTQWCWHFW